MGSDAQPSAMFGDFGLPHGNNESNDDGDGHQLLGLEQVSSDDDGEGQHLADFEKDFSDDEDYQATFEAERKYPGPRSKTTPQNKARVSPARTQDTEITPQSKAKKSPRRPDDNEVSTPKSKKPCPVTIFGGGPKDLSDGDADDEEISPRTPGQGIRVRLFSLTLEQQDRSSFDVLDSNSDKDEDVSNMHTNLSDREHSLSEEDEYAPKAEDPALAYGLRQNIDRNVAPATWVDVDQSGNYDPQAEAREKALRLNKARAKKKDKNKQETATKTREPRLKLIVRLRIQNFGNVLNITNGMDHWSDGHSVIDTDEEQEIQEERERQAFFHRRTPGVEPQEPIIDPKGDLHDLTGYPVARGCKECRKQDQHCSSISDGEFPCAQCIENNTECEAIIEHSLSGPGPCSSCEERDIRCSFEDGCGGALCDQCLDNGNLDCAPSMPSVYKADRVDLDRILYGTDRKYANCTYCRTHKKRCSLKTKDDKPPCKHCKRHSIGCTFYDAQSIDDLLKKGKAKGKGRQKNTSTTASRPSHKKGKDALPVSMPGSDFFAPEDLMDIDANSNDDQVPEREDTPEIEMEDAEGRIGVMTKVSTCFAHPIRFSFSTSDDDPDCSFCVLPAFGFVGHFEKTIHVIKWHNGMGYTELAAGHREEQPATTMCNDCTLVRVQIIACPGHELRQIYNYDTEQDYDDAVGAMLSAELKSEMMRYQLERWCSMCFSLAKFYCCRQQPSVTSPTDDDEIIEGCGLKLCDRCEQEFREVFRGDFKEMVDNFDSRPKAAESAEAELQAMSRADVGLLKADGLLMKSAELMEY